ncbi:glycosyl hydrolase family 16 [Coprinopsis cinerea AmutBmut pab1-1]|nr:glycosyl hydrolase family 16 [Coprinopsis cinerea AmutBmut pab1-1]
MTILWKQKSVLLSLVGLAQAVTYHVTKEYSGSTFFNDWDFYGSHDNLTNGDVEFISASEARTPSSLAYVDPNTNRAIVKVDNTTEVPYMEKRKAVRITSKDAFPVGSVFITDIHHAPYGCSVWPSWRAISNTPSVTVDTKRGDRYFRRH